MSAIVTAVEGGKVVLLLQHAFASFVAEHLRNLCGRTAVTISRRALTGELQSLVSRKLLARHIERLCPLLLSLPKVSAAAEGGDGTVRSEVAKDVITAEIDARMPAPEARALRILLGLDLGDKDATQRREAALRILQRYIAVSTWREEPEREFLDEFLASRLLSASAPLVDAPRVQSDAENAEAIVSAPSWLPYHITRVQIEAWPAASLREPGRKSYLVELVADQPDVTHFWHASSGQDSSQKPSNTAGIARVERVGRIDNGSTLFRYKLERAIGPKDGPTAVRFTAMDHIDRWLRVTAYRSITEVKLTLHEERQLRRVVRVSQPTGLLPQVRDPQRDVAADEPGVYRALFTDLHEGWDYGLRWWRQGEL